MRGLRLYENGIRGLNARGFEGNSDQRCKLMVYEHAGKINKGKSDPR